MVNLNWPLVVTQVAFNVGGNDPATLPSWTDLSARTREFACSSGRQYEIDQNQAGEATATFSDKDEALNPANGSSPYYPNVLPYRQILQQAMWPPVPVGAAVNLLNSVAGYDPGLENTAVGGQPDNFIWYTYGTPVVSTVNPQQGSHSLAWSVTGGGGGQYVGLTIPAIPGRQYTASVYVRQSAANTLVPFINFGATGATSATVGAYVRLTVTFVATQPLHDFYIGYDAPTLSGSVWVDAWQLEPGASASAWTTTGPKIFGVFRGYVERWPSSWNHQGLYGICKATCVDALAVLANIKMHTEITNVIMNLVPDYYWRLDGAGPFGDTSGNSGPPLSALDSTYGPATTYTPGTDLGIAGDPGGSGVAISSPVATPQPASVVQTGSIYTPKATQRIAVGGSPPFGFTVSVIATRTTTVATGGRFVMLATENFNQRLAEFLVYSGPPQVGFLAGGTSGVSSGLTYGADYWADGKPHVYTMTVAVDATNFTINAYVDGGALGTQVLATSGFTFPLVATQIQIGGLVSESSIGTWAKVINPGLAGGGFAHVAVWNRALTAVEATLLRYGLRGFDNEYSGGRVARWLGYRFNGLYGTSTGASLMGPSDLPEGTSLLDACQAAATTENGNFVANAYGTVLFTSRTDRYLNLYADWVLGELELPYEAGITFDFDPTRVANTVKITQTPNGAVATAVDAASQKAYFPREFDRSVNVADYNEAVDAATWLLSQMKDPHIRVASIVLKPSANPALWPVALGIAIGDRVTVKRRALSGGLTMSLDFFVEKIEHSEKAGEWLTTLQLSPASTSRVPWILQDATYGLLGSTTYLGY